MQNRQRTFIPTDMQVFSRQQSVNFLQITRLSIPLTFGKLSKTIKNSPAFFGQPCNLFCSAHTQQSTVNY